MSSVRPSLKCMIGLFSLTDENAASCVTEPSVSVRRIGCVTPFGMFLCEMMPVAVARLIDHQMGSLTWWVDGVQFDEGERVKQSANPPNPGDWSRQMCRMRVFTQLVADADRNQTNLLITSDWKLWMIDFTRAFRLKKEIGSLDVTRCDRQLLARMQTLTRPMIEEKTKHLLSGGEIDALLARRDAIVARINQLVAERGEALVLF